MTIGEFFSDCVLVVDGCEDGRCLMGKIFRGKLGLPVHAAASAAEALDWLQAQTPCLILIDLYLPDMSGLELSLHLRQLPSLKDVPVVGVTSLLLPEDLSLFRSAGLSEIVVKPINLPEFIQHLRRLLAREGAGAPEGFK